MHARKLVEIPLEFVESYREMSAIERACAVVSAKYQRGIFEECAKDRMTHIELVDRRIKRCLNAHFGLNDTEYRDRTASFNATDADCQLAKIDLEIAISGLRHAAPFAQRIKARLHLTPQAPDLANPRAGDRVG